MEQNELKNISTEVEAAPGEKKKYFLDRKSTLLNSSHVA